MNILQIGISVFVFIEFLNIMMLYFMPGSKMGNGVGVFNDYHTLNENEDSKEFVGYLINWVAGAKLIFIMIGIVVVIGRSGGIGGINVIHHFHIRRRSTTIIIRISSIIPITRKGIFLIPHKLLLRKATSTPQ